MWRGHLILREWLWCPPRAVNVLPGNLVSRCSHILSCSVSWQESFYWACLDIWLTCDFLGWEVHTHMHGYVVVCLRRCSAYSLPSWGFLELPCSHRGGRHGRPMDPVGRAHMRPSAQIYCSDLEVSGQAKANESQHPAWPWLLPLYYHMVFFLWFVRVILAMDPLSVRKFHKLFVF